jgi:hypothetical protein
MGIDVKGVDDEIAKGKSNELKNWASMIEGTTREICGDTLNNITLKHTFGTSFELELKDKKAVDCLVQAIDRYIHSMPIALQGVFQKLATDALHGRFNPSIRIQWKFEK